MRQKSLFLAALSAAVGFYLSGRPVHAALSKPDEQKAATEASGDADKWAASQKEAPKPVEEAKPAPTPEPAKAGVETKPSEQAIPEPPKAASVPAPSPVKPKSKLNEMTGKIVSVEDEPAVLRLALEGGYSIEFTYTRQTTITNGGNPIQFSDLYYGDKVQVFYAGKDLHAVSVERLEKAPRPFAE